MIFNLWNIVSPYDLRNTLVKYAVNYKIIQNYIKKYICFIMKKMEIKSIKMTYIKWSPLLKQNMDFRLTIILL